MISDSENCAGIGRNKSTFMTYAWTSFSSSVLSVIEAIDALRHGYRLHAAAVRFAGSVS